jgi:F0F1-type ATP synthase assembly protein I
MWARRAGTIRTTGKPASLDNMPDNDRGLFLARSVKSLQENLRRSAPAATASRTMIGAILLLGGIGYALDVWMETATPWFLFGGLVLGMIIGFYGLAKSVWHK